MICPSNQKGTNGAEILVDYCAQRLDPSRAVELEKHLEQCADCRRVVRAQSEVWDSMDLWTPASVSPDFDARLYARIARERTDPAWMQWYRRIFHPPIPFMMWKPALSLAAACAVLAAAFVIHVPAPGSSHPVIAPEKIDIEQVERTLDDMDIVTPVAQSPAS